MAKCCKQLLDSIGNVCQSCQACGDTYMLAVAAYENAHEYVHTFSDELAYEAMYWPLVNIRMIREGREHSA